MRSGKWYSDIAKELKTTRLGVPLEVLCPVELGLTLLLRLDAGQPPTSVWALLGGYPFAQAAGLATKPEQEWMITCVRHRLWPLRRREAWIQALREYQAVDASHRAFRVAKGLDLFEWTGTTTLTMRFDVYDRALETLPDFVERHLAPAGAGRFYYFDHDERVEIEIPDDVATRPGASGRHNLTARTTTNGAPIDVSWAALEEVAAWMDRQATKEDARTNWQTSIRSTRLLVRDAHGHDFTHGDRLRLDGLLHAVGVVGVGKSTLMKVLAVWATRRPEPLRITLVVGDVAEQLRTAKELREFLQDDRGFRTADRKPPVVPVIGSSTREQHVEALHRRLAANGHLLLAGHHEEEGFGDLSTVCPLDALRATERPVRFADAPCARLYEEDGQSDGRRPRPWGCPLWHECPRHGTARLQVSANVWIATMASLVMSPVPAEVSGVRLHQLELACLRSDIIVIDEADRVMMNLDRIFAPTATLVSRGPHSWLDALHTHNIRELAQEGRLQLSNRNVRNWEVALSVVTSATNLLYSMLIADEDLREWVGIEYFNSWTLQRGILSELFPADDSAKVGKTTPAHHAPPAPTDRAQSPRGKAEAVFDQFRDDPLGDNGPYDTAADRLTAAAQDLLHTLNPQAAASRLCAVLDELRAIGKDTEHGLPESTQPVLTAEDDPLVRKLEFALLLSVLHHRLDRLTYLWPQVEDAMRLDITENELIRRPPLDYMPLVPESPMGNVLGFQYIVDEQDSTGGGVTGTLRFFRCTGVGRELLFSLPSLGADPITGRGGPHVLLLSGTSWAGTSSRAHVVIPVGAVLQPSADTENRLRETVFTTRFFHDDNGEPISLSGQPRKVRPSVLRALVNKLGRPGPSRMPPLEEEIQAVADPKRHRALLLVGNYQDAQAVADQLHAMPEWRDHVKALVADNADLAEAIDGGTEDPGRAGTLRRGEVANLADDAMTRVLVAPLLAIERGHNILNEDSQAAIGVALLLTRPHPVPTDVSLSVFAINDWESRYIRGLCEPEDSEPGSLAELVSTYDSLDAAAQKFRDLARSRWGRLLTRRYAYASLKEDERRSFAWDQLVVLWQVIGRLVRGGVAARVVFVDAQFARGRAAAQALGARKKRPPRDTARTSLLHAIRDALRPYFDPGPGDEQLPLADLRLAGLLYEPVYRALCAMLDQADLDHDFTEAGKG
ncbi:hypothetical protein N8J89_14060 [Crossiella sp. CA-258035]|uniref:pPIWI_RE_Z domain-containing protein n=1 Tax=Crossiella sp. CA-258035 TaxID=2981138 RepID=UPI0024BC0965|nr:hypothetical protein [Crossiella sp. CA-258035]WHT22140.1 hypothetical protein N8J89_14060 [Crossiella sp. CA-258035]